VNDDAPVEQHLQRRIQFDESLRRGIPFRHRRCRKRGLLFEYFDPGFELPIHLRGQNRDRRKLLLTEQTRHILAQHLAGEKRQGPQTQHENEQRGECHPGFERARMIAGQIHTGPCY